MTRYIFLIIAGLFIGSGLAQKLGSQHEGLIKDIFQIPDSAKYKSCGDQQQCVPPDLCKNSEIVTTGEGVFEFSIDQCPSSEVCCRIPKQNVKYKSCGNQKECVPRHLCKDSKVLILGEGAFDFHIDGCENLDLCCNIPGRTMQIPRSDTPSHSCGYHSPDGVGIKLMGDLDNKSQFGEFPWMAAILREEEARNAVHLLYECGAALIAPTVALTAAHCVYNHTAATVVVRAGEWDKQNTDEILPHQERRVREIIIHEDFNKDSFINDVALLIVETPFVWEAHIRPICLPEVNTDFDHSRCFLTGWGKDNSNKDAKYDSILKKIDLPVVPRDQCQKNLRPTRLGWYFELHQSFICAGGEKNKGSCEGHGGSPLICPIPNVSNRFYQAGIVAWRIGCGVENVPGVYASVSYQRSWLDSKLSARGIDFKSFTP